MDARNADTPAHKSPWLAPLLCSLLLLAALGFALYTLYGSNSLAALEPAPEAQQQKMLNDKLAQEKATLESLRDRQPCEVRQWMLDHGFAVPTPTASTLPAATVSSGTANATDKPPTAPPAQSTAAPAPGSPTVIDLLEDATVFVLAATDSSMSMGSGFFFTPTMVLTNRHVIESSRGNIIVINKKLRKVARATLVAVSDSPRRDYAVLRVDMPQGVNMTPLALGPLPRRAARVSAWGYPHAITKDDPKYQALISGLAQAAPELVYTDGVVSAVLERTPPLIVHTAPLSPGSSGGPLANEQGQVVGINTLITLDEDSYRQTSIALPATDILAFLREKGIEVRQ